jgi:ribonuclease HI
MMRVFIDGGARRNPGPAGYGVRIERPDGTLAAELHGAVGVATNNVAEYHSLIAALTWLVEHGCRDAEIRSDSELLVKQMRGEYKIKNENLRPLASRARLLLTELGRVTLRHVPRAENKEADRLANIGMDEAENDAGHKT